MHDGALLASRAPLALQENAGLVGGTIIAYMARNGVMQTPRQTAYRPSSAHSHREGAHYGRRPFSVSAASLYNRIGTAAAPVLIDVRRRPAFDDDEWMIAGAIRRPPDTVGEWGADTPKGQPVVVYCAHGQEVSRNVAASLRGIGVDARYLEGGIAGWAEHRLPLRKKVPLGD